MTGFDGVFYTYCWRDADLSPFYVGKGKGNRANSLASRSPEFLAIHAQGGCTVEIVDEFIHESQAHAHEMELIEKYGRREFGGLLVNKTDGGEGASGSFHSEETRAKMSASGKGKTRTPETRSRISAARIGMVFSLEHRANIRAAKSNPSNETRAKLSLASANMSRETRSKISAAVRNPSAETRAMLSAAARMSPPRRGGYKGVYFEPARGRWASRIFLNGKQAMLGRFPNAEEAAHAYDAAAFSAWGKNCYLNFQNEVM